MISEIKNKFVNSSERSKDIVKNVGLSLGTKAASILSSLLLVPMTINYVNPTQYGIWLTLSSVIGWIAFFDLGLGNGFRNKFAEAKAQGDTLLARQLLSTTYFAIGSIIGVVLIVALAINSFVDWSAFLKVSPVYMEELHKIFIVVCTFTCINMVANVFSSLLAADQKTGYSSVITCIGQYLSLLVIFVLTKTTSGSLYNLALYYSGIPCLVIVVVSLYMFFFSKYKVYRPGFKYIKVSLVRNILQLGTQFFVIYLCLIAIFQIVNIVITREIGPLGVTQYNIANKYFNIVYMLMNIIVSPFWSAITDAYVKKDYAWIVSMRNRLMRCWLCMLVCCAFMVPMSSLFYRIWIGQSVEMPLEISVAMAFLIVAQSYGSIFMTMINGIGTVRIQMVVYVLFAIFSWPLFKLSASYFGLVGVIAIPAVVYLAQGILGNIQLNKILNHTAKGIWTK